MPSPPGATDRVEASIGGPRAQAEEQLRSVVSTVVAGPFHRGASVFLEGPPGIGKTHLGRSVTATAQAAGATVLSARGEDRRRRVSFAVIRDLFGPLGGAVDPAEAAFELVDSRCAAGPVVCWVDDAHHLDAASIGVLRRLVWAARDLPLVVLVSARSYPRREPLDVLANQVRTRIRLPVMDHDMVDSVVRTITGRSPGPRLSQYLRASGGNPLFVTEMVAALRDGGHLTRPAPDVVDLRGDPRPTPEGLGALVREHLRQLDESVTELLRAMTILGRGATLDDLAAVLYESSASLWISVDRAVRSGLVVWDAADHLDFGHDLYREAAYESLDNVSRQALHRRAARLLRERGADVALVAEHLVRSTDGTTSDVSEGTDAQVELIDALRSAARESSAHAPAVAADLLSDLQAVVGADEGELDRLVVERAGALHLSGQHERAERLADEHLAVTRDPQTRQELHALLIRSQLNRGHTGAALESIDRLLAVTLPDPARRRLSALRCWVMTMAGRWREAEREALDIVDRSPPEEERQAQAWVLTVLSCAAHLDGRSVAATELIERQLALLDDGADVQAHRSALVWPAVFDLSSRGVDAAAVSLARCRRATADLGARWLDPYHCFIAADIAARAGEWDDASAEVDAGLEMAEEIGSGWISTAVALRAYLDAHRGHPRLARIRLGRFRRQGLPLQFGADEPGRAALAVLETTPAPDRAVRLARDLWGAAEGMGPVWMLELAPDVARVGLTGADQELCERVAAQVTTLDVSGCPATAPVVDLVAGMSIRDVDRIERAARAFRSYGDVLHATFGWEESACAAAAAGQRDRARDRLELAVAGYQTMGAVPDLDRLFGRARSLGLRRGPRAKHRTAAYGPASLTTTEVRVARLVQQGMTNPQIAAQLWLSPRTVQTHVSHILAKLGVRSRTDVTGVQLPP